MGKKDTKRIELLAPAGNLEKLEIAMNYGADAVYLSGKNFNLRNFSDNFSLKKMGIARRVTYKNKTKLYIAVNSFIKNKEIPFIKRYLNKIRNISPDALIISDPAVFIITKKILPKISIHISTQANSTNYYSAMFWEKLGAKRINIARELSLEEIKEIIIKNKIEIETFAHGAMCMSYSGKCLLSNFITNRESNQGKCCQACRFKYSVMEEKRPGENLPIYEDNKFSYVFNSKDLCMINHVDSLINIGISSIKIEGRMKSSNYLASIIKIYREAIDNFYSNSNCEMNFLKKNWYNQLFSINNRKYTTGFFFKNFDKKEFNGNKNHKLMFIGKIIYPLENGSFFIKVKNKIYVGDQIKIISSSQLLDKYTQIYRIYDNKQNNYLNVQSGDSVCIKTKIKCKKNDIVQKIIK